MTRYDLHRIMRINVFFLYTVSAFAGVSPKLGVYAGAPIIKTSEAFELLPGGQARVTSDFFHPDGSRNEASKKVLSGRWIYSEPFLVLTYGEFKDKFRREDCLEKFSCFKFEKPLAKGLSPLNNPYGYSFRNLKH